ncbi:MAG TPA: sialidase family protein [Clostridia bacterium]|nr:sialidase family protein [Clostridia bacterium]
MNHTPLTRRQFLKTTGLTAIAAGAGLPLAALNEDQPVLDLNPSPENPRNSEGAFVALASGRILFLYTRFHGGADDASPARIVSIFSDDQGRTWDCNHQVAVENEAGANVMSVSLLRLRSGKIALFYLVKNSLIDCRPVMRLSTDEARTWSEPRVVTDAPGYFVLNNDRVIQLKNGRLVMPLAFHRARHGDSKSYRSWDGRAMAFWYASDDEGGTWAEAKDWWALPVRSGTGLQEPGVVELADGRLFSWMRTDQGVQYGCYSADEGKTWPLPKRTELASPTSPASIKQLPGSSELLAVFNDHSGRFPFPKGKRSPLVAAISSDGGKTWPRRKVIEPDPDGWYCYTAMHFVEHAVLLAYCAGDSKVGGLNRLRIRQVPLAWLPG